MTPEKFWRSCTVTPTGCWEWTRYRTRQGYGRVVLPRYSTIASRAAWELVNGAIPKGRSVMHICDNPPCINPAHLILGSPADNSRDMVQKRRQASGVTHGMYGKRGVLAPMYGVRGEQHPRAKLSEAAVRKIRESSDTQRCIAKKYGISQSNVSLIKRLKSWAQL